MKNLFSSKPKDISIVQESASPLSLHRFRKFRMWFAWAFALVMFVYSRSSTRGLLIGVPFIVAGETIRIWSHGYLRKVRKLATDGPYAYVRNPLYFGNFLLGLGFCVVVWQPIIFLIYVNGFFLVYWLTVRGEEEKLEFKFGEAFKSYRKAVPRFIPRLTPYEKRSNAKFAFHRVLGHGELITLLAIINLFLVVYIRQELFQEKKPLSMMTGVMIGFIFFLSVLLVSSMINRKWRGSKKYKRYRMHSIQQQNGSPNFH